MLGWEPKVSFKELARIMVDSDMKLAERELRASSQEGALATAGWGVN